MFCVCDMQSAAMCWRQRCIAIGIKYLDCVSRIRYSLSEIEVGTHEVSELCSVYHKRAAAVCPRHRQVDMKCVDCGLGLACSLQQSVTDRDKQTWNMWTGLCFCISLLETEVRKQETGYIWTVFCVLHAFCSSLSETEAHRQETGCIWAVFCVLCAFCISASETEECRHERYVCEQQSVVCAPLLGTACQKQR